MIERPDWWHENQTLRDQLDLPEYEAPRFKDGQYTYTVVNELERCYNCRLQFVGYNTEYPEDWLVEADGDPLFPIGRHRDSSGNTIYEMATAVFVRRVGEYLESDDADQR